MHLRLRDPVTRAWAARAPVAHGPREGPAVALTFDDGPGAITDGLLEVLARHRAQATFNVLGERIADGADTIRRVAAAGHELGVHGWRHEDHRRRPPAHAAGVARTAAALRRLTGTPPRVFRPPFGLCNRRLTAAVAAVGLVTVLWDVDPRDFEAPPAETITERVRAGVRPGSIVLLHDDRPQLHATVAAVDAILGDLAARRLRPVTVSQLLSGGGRRA